MSMNHRNLFLGLLLLSASVLARAEDATPLTAWWEGKHATGDWFGVRPALADRGFNFDGRWRGVYFGILESENGSGNAFSQEVVFAGQLDAAKATGWAKTDGLSLFTEVRWRDPGRAANPNNFVEADSLFNPSRYTGGVGWRLMTAGFRYAVPEFFGVEDGLILNGGWIQPQKEFVDQPLARLFVNNAMASADGLGGNIPFSSSFSTWGGTVEARPSAWYYVKTGLFLAFPNPTDPANRGLQFRGHGDPAQNGLFFMGETGLTPEIGPAKLPGKYAFGAYVYGENNEEYGGNKSAYYWQADQMIWREDGEEGLGAFSFFAFAPRYNNDFSFYMHGGLVYRGLIPCRGRDELMAAVAVGNYGAGMAEDGVQPTQTVLMEAGYRIKISGWSFVQPFAQYISRPDGLADVSNAAILGLSLGVDF